MTRRTLLELQRTVSRAGIGGALVSRWLERVATALEEGHSTASEATEAVTHIGADAHAINELGRGTRDLTSKVRDQAVLATTDSEAAVASVGELREHMVTLPIRSRRWRPAPRTSGRFDGLIDDQRHGAVAWSYVVTIDVAGELWDPMAFDAAQVTVTGAPGT